ncbi:MAG: DUF1801 domain-containing protein [Acidobacteriota bacterium]
MTVDQYLAAVSQPARATLEKIRTIIRAAAPAETTEVINYGIPMFRYKGNLLGYAAFAKHCSLFPTPGVIEALQDELKNFPLSKGTVRFPVDKPPSAALLKKMVKIRVAQIEKKER